MRTIFFRRPKKQLIIGGLVSVFVIFFFLAHYHAPDEIGDLHRDANPFGKPQERIGIPLAEAKAHPPPPFQDNRIDNAFKNAPQGFPEHAQEIVNEHRGLHQPAAVKRHFEVNPQVEGAANVPGALPDNAQVAEDSLLKIHEAARENEKQEAANLVPPDNLNFNPPNAQDNHVVPVHNDADDGGIPFYLTPRRPPEISTSISKGPGKSCII